MFEPGTKSHAEMLKALKAAVDEARARRRSNPTPDHERQHEAALLRLTEFVNKPYRPR